MKFLITVFSLIEIRLLVFLLILYQPKSNCLQMEKKKYEKNGCNRESFSNKINHLHNQKISIKKFQSIQGKAMTYQNISKLYQTILYIQHFFFFYLFSKLGLKGHILIAVLFSTEMYISFQNIHFITLKLHYITLHYITLHYITYITILRKASQVHILKAKVD